MKPFELALVEGCAVKCANEIRKTLKILETAQSKLGDKHLLRSQIITAIREHLGEIENANRN